MTASPAGRARHVGWVVLGWLVAACAPAWAGRAGVSVSPLPSDRQALENVFLGGGPEVRFVFSPSFPSRPAAAALPSPPSAPSAPELSFRGLSIAAYRFGAGGEAVLAAVIDQTQQTVRLASPFFASPEVAEALVRAKRRGVDVRLLTEHGQVGQGEARTTEMQTVIFGGVTVRSLPGTGPSGALRGSFGLFDGQLLETGSLRLGEVPRARDGMLFRDEPGTVAGFDAYWSWMWAQAKPLSGLPNPPQYEVPHEEPRASLRFKGQAWPAWALPAQNAGEERLAAALELCRVSADLALPGLTPRLAEAAVRAAARGTAVRVVAAPGAKPELLWALVKAGVAVSLFPRGALRAQFAVLDGELAESGSFEPDPDGPDGLGAAVFSAAPADLKGFAAEFAYLLNPSR